MDPVTGGGVSTLAKVLGLVKEWPLWLLVAIALCLSVFLAVPDFRRLASPEMETLLWFVLIVAWIFATVRGVQPAVQAVRRHRERRET